jgi:signal transduction histidine kinase
MTESTPPAASDLRGGLSLGRAVAEGVPQCAYVKDAVGRYVAVNRPLCDWLGKEPEEILGRTDPTLWPLPLARHYGDLDRRVCAGERVEGMEPRPRGAATPLVRALRLPLYDAGAVSGLLGLFWEPPAPAPDEEERRQAQRLEVVGRLAAGVTHDFNNLLTALQCGLGLLEESGIPAEVLSVLRQATEQAGRLTGQLLSFLRRRPRGPEAVDVNGLVREVLTVVGSTVDPRITVQARLAEGLPSLPADAGGLSQVLFNLCLNACDAMTGGGRLLVQTEELRWPQEPGSLEGEAVGVVRLSVTDSGEGMSPEVRARVFDPFFTTKATGRGTGLGLNIVREIVQQHRGWVECDSTPGVGSRFDVYLPVGAGLEPARGEAAAVRSGAGQTVLLADNEPSIRLLLRLVLQGRGYRVLGAENGQQALELYGRALADADTAAGGPRPLALLDCRMPGLTAEEVLAGLVALDPGVRVVLTSGLPQPDLPEALSGNLRGFLPKPFRVEQLLYTVQEALTGSE